MQPGEVLVALLSGGATVVRFQEETASRVSVALGRKKQARVPADRIILATGVIASAQEQFEEFRSRALEMSSEIDLSEVWEVLADDAEAIGLEKLGELYWASPPDAPRLVALALHLDRGTDLFALGQDGFVPRSRLEVEETSARRRREAENALEAEALASSLGRGTLPEPVTNHQETLLEILRGYAVYGEDFPRRGPARALLASVASGTRDLQRRCFELLVGVGVFSPDEPLELLQAGIRERFPEDAVVEAGSIGLEAHLSEPRRRDLTGLAAITIDDADADDRDDALSLDAVEGGYRIGVHIADAGSLIPRDGAVDREADRRMATLYLPERKVEMLPPGLARRLGSLDPGQDRCAISLMAKVDTEGEVLDWETTPSVVRSSAALSYEEADLALDDPASPWRGLLTGLSDMAQALRRRRERAGAITIDQAELAVRVGPMGEVEIEVHDRSSRARQLVTELMVLYNSLLAELCRDHGLPAVYRSQSRPDLTDIELEIQGGAGGPPGPPGLDAAGGPVLSDAEVTLRRYMITRRLAPAQIDTTPSPHEGLGVQAYLQATSPLRRYPDLVIQRQISHFLATGEPLYPLERVASVGQRAEVQLREMAKVEDSRKRYWFLKYLQQSRLEDSGAPESLSLFPATVLDNPPRRLAMLELAEFPFRVRAELPRDRVPGGTVTLKLEGVDLWRRIGLFVHVP